MRSPLVHKSSAISMWTSRGVVAACLACAVLWSSGCAGGGNQGAALSGNTQVTILATTTANDRWTYFGAGVSTLTLTSQNGKTVSLLQTAAGDEFMHLNGTVEPLTTVSIPAGIYTSATASLSGLGFECVTSNSAGGITDSTTSYQIPIPAASVTVTLPKPITISGTSAGLLLDLQISKSLTYPPGCGNSQVSYTVTPTFVLTSMAIPGQSTNSGNGKVLNLMGMVTSINSGGSEFTVTSPFSVETDVQVSNNTVFQGIQNFSQLAVGMPVDVDGALQQGGSITASRLAVYDTNTTNLSIDIGPLLLTNMTWSGLSSSSHLLALQGAEASEGKILGMSHYPYWDYSNATFQTTAQFSNVTSLPFSASFNSSNMAAGQRVMLTSHLPSIPQQNPYGNPQPTVNTVTLLPQVVNGTVSSITTEGGFTLYTVTLASYDIAPTFAATPNQNSALANPSTVVVYADSNAQMLNTAPIAVGSVARFYGLVFNDNGTLRMDCAQINDGVAE